MLLALALAVLVPGPRVSADPVVWAVDMTHSDVSFRIRHLVSRVTGTFNDWSGTIVADPDDLRSGSVEVTIKTGSVDTRNERRDTHLRSPDFFAADSFPEITFKSHQVEVKGSTIKVAGDLTLRGITKPVELKGEFIGLNGPPEAKKQRIGFSASAKINRLDYGVKYNRALEAGGMLLGDEVEIFVNIEAVRQ
jgi:polyisoprenoid-binding protein YceI